MCWIKKLKREREELLDFIEVLYNASLYSSIKCDQGKTFALLVKFGRLKVKK